MAQDELDDEDDWNPCKAAGVCLSLVAGCCEDAILPIVCPFVLENLAHSDWKRRDAAIMALGMITAHAQVGCIRFGFVNCQQPSYFTLTRVCNSFSQ